MIGRTISHYKITAKLGQGGMGEVYLATDTKLDRQVALKFLPQQFSGDTDAQSRFQREAKALAALNHPNIVYVHDVSEHNGSPYIVMEYIEGQSLKQYVATGDVEIDTVLDIVSQAADGLSAAHKREIIHRDIKSENIIITPEGRVKIMDFGLATWRGVSKVTKEGSTVGTMAYMSPEQAEGRAVDHRADLFSLGVVFYELITGRLPFAGDHEAAIIYSIVNETPEPLARYKSGLPDGLQEIVSKALDKDPELRHQTASGFLSDIRRLRKLSESSVSVTAGRIVPSPPPSRKGLIISASVVAVIALLLFIFKHWKVPVQPTQEAEAGYKTLAVLPFENLGSAEDEYFADGITDEITSRLARISGLRVTARTSSKRYKDTDKPVGEIGAELGVDYVLEGTIRWDKASDTDRVRITPQLIQCADDFHVWAENYERALTQIFAVQSDIAENIAAALDVNLLDPERRLVQERPTQNLEAYNYYLRGLEYGLGEGQKMSMFERAIALDSSFAHAYARLSISISYRHWNGADPELTPIERAEELAQHALQLNPDLPEAHMAMGYYHYWGSRDYEAALQEFETALRHQPRQSELFAAIAYVKRRQGRWTEGLDLLKRALELDPVSMTDRNAIIGYLIAMRRFDEAQAAVAEALSLFPEEPHLYCEAMTVAIGARGDLQSAYSQLDKAARQVKVAGSQRAIALGFWTADRYSREHKRTLSRDMRFLESTSTVADTAQYYFLLAEAYLYCDSPAVSRAYYDSARVYLEPLQAFDRPWGGDLPPSLGIIYARLGRKDEAIEAALREVATFPLSRDARIGAEALGNLAVMYALVGEREQAIDALEEVMSVPSLFTVATLRLDPYFDALRDHPRFQALIEKGDVVF